MAAVWILFALNLIPGPRQERNRKTTCIPVHRKFACAKNGWGEVDVYCSRHFEWKRTVGQKSGVPATIKFVSNVNQNFSDRKYAKETDNIDFM